MAAVVKMTSLISFFVLMAVHAAHGAIPKSIMSSVERANSQGPFVGVVVPNSFEMSPLLRSPCFVQDNKLPYLDFGGRRFRFGRINGEKVVIIMTGLSMLNAGISTQLLLTLFNVRGVVHFGIAGNANPDLQIGDVTIPQYWAHSGLWNWQRYGDGPDDELAFEPSGDYTRGLGCLNFSKYVVGADHAGERPGNFLNSAWYQPEEIFSVIGVPELRQHAFWVPVDTKYFELSRRLEAKKLERCVNSTTCLDRRPMVVRVERGCSSNAFVDNAAYRRFLRSKLNVTAIDMESAAVALVCLQQQVPFIAMRALSDLAGGGSSQSNEASIFSSLASQNAVDVIVQFISLLA